MSNLKIGDRVRVNTVGNGILHSERGKVGTVVGFNPAEQPIDWGDGVVTAALSVSVEIDGSVVKFAPVELERA